MIPASPNLIIYHDGAPLQWYNSRKTSYYTINNNTTMALCAYGIIINSC